MRLFSKSKLVLFSLLLCILFWFMESFGHYFLLPNIHSVGTSIQPGILRELFSPSAHELYTRISIIVLILVFSIVAQLMLNRQKFFATHDMITTLPNRYLVQKLITDRIKRFDTSKCSHTLVICKPSNLALIRRIISTAEADNLILEIATKMKAQFGDTLLGVWKSDNFVLLLRHELHHHDKFVEQFLKKVSAIFEKPIYVSDFPFHFELTLGACEYQTGYNANVWVKNSYKALSKAFSEALKFSSYNKADDREDQDYLRFIGEFFGALKQNELTLYLQPKVDINTNKTDSFEALSRWNHPNKGLLTPGQYIPKIEERVAILDFARYNIELAFDYFVKLQALNNKNGLSINLSSVNLHDHELTHFIKEKIHQHQIDPEYIHFEITETSFLSNPELAIKTLKSIFKLGFKISLDDFGTGFNSLSYLNKFHVDEIKIDRSFITNIDTNFINQIIVKNMTILAHSIKARVCAEGIETEKEYAFLKSIGCDLGQGYYWSKPKSFQETLDEVT